MIAEPTYSDTESYKLTIKFCCNTCHGSLNRYGAPDRRYYVRCISCNENRGFVTRTTADHRDADEFGDRAEMRQVLRMNGIPHDDYDPTKEFNEAEALAALGF